MRGPFEPPGRDESAVSNGSAAAAPGTSVSQDASASVWPPASAKMDQIKDLYLTAEAIGEDALDKHFQLVSERQRQLIREYFNQAVASQAESQDRGWLSGG